MDRDSPDAKEQRAAAASRKASEAPNEGPGVEQAPPVQAPVAEKPGTTASGTAPLTTAQEIIIIVTGILAFFRPSWKQAVANVGNTYLYFYYYLSAGRVRLEIVGQIRAQVERFSEHEAPKYRKIHIIAYSFGSVAALDALFPFNDPPPRGFSKIEWLVTIGCPFDAIRTYFREAPKATAAPGGADPPKQRGYFEQRAALQGVPKSWLNVYSLADVLSSNFRNNGAAGPAEVGIGVRVPAADGAGAPTLLTVKPENIHFKGPFNSEGPGFFGLLTLYGIRSHGNYWSGDAIAERNCFDMISPRMFQDHPILQ